jgi:hypothetical protein
LAAAQAAAQKAVSKTYRVRIRSTPGLSGSILGYLSKGESVTVNQRGNSREKIDGKQEFWYQVATSSGVTGWVFGGFLDGLTDAAAALPVSPGKTPAPAPAPAPEPIQISEPTTESCGRVKSILTSTVFGLKTAVKYGQFLDNFEEKRSGCQIFATGLSAANAGLLQKAFREELTKRGWTLDGRYAGDGAEGGFYGLARGGTLCVQEWRTRPDESQLSDIRIDCFDVPPPPPANNAP